MADCISLARGLVEGREVGFSLALVGSTHSFTDEFEEESERVKSRPSEAGDYGLRATGDVIHGEKVTAREDPGACK